MPYIPGSNPNTLINSELIDIQNQITDLQNQLNTKIAGLQTQIKQVTLTLEGELKTVLVGFQALKDFVNSKLPS